MDQAEQPGPRSRYAIGLADDSFEWYRKHATRARRVYKASETALVAVAAAIPVSAVLAPDNTTVPAILGAVVVIISGLRSIFHWQENYVRFSQAREAIEAERRMYNTGASPYSDPSSRDQTLAAAVTRIERDEMLGWVEIASVRPKS